MFSLYDIIIVGLGPAGSTLARLLDKRYKVAVIDKKWSYEKGFHKPCGGLLATDAQKSLSRFGLTLPMEVLVDPQIFAVRTIDLDTNVTQHYQRFYINLDRQKFDLWLKSLIPEHVDIFDNSICTRIIKQEDHYDVEFMNEDKIQTISAKYIVGADGANSIVRRYLYPNKKIRSYVSIQQWFTEKNLKPFYSCIFDFSGTCVSLSIHDRRFLSWDTCNVFICIHSRGEVLSSCFYDDRSFIHNYHIKIDLFYGFL